MIFVTLGTFPVPFTRPLKELEDLCRKKIIDEKIVVQSGHTEFVSEFMEVSPFMPPDKINELTKAASLIITHAGTGSLIKAVRLKKKVIAIPRLYKLGENVDDHQLDILEIFTEKGYVLPWHEDDKLERLLNDLKSFQPNEYVSKKQVIIDYLENYINSL
ncbi:PssE/Cps14G family polysaccharide biosynthesis glycosyltransferase [Croceivirga thetidis]|uniref:Exopolysaccharide biosynthesis protein n=1 Tax=Croceivirga thetidis TaxID=2721623 RepID=A0ABX1GQ74_9FLAO|nr:PssE/Cps14G family polysaccharide biosynthesis glycosyltransferase [Croceivirga thetidis]NKI32049.1 exopolysaccharide biosynthesis protein [Croceivirga thetidis]